MKDIQWSDLLFNLSISILGGLVKSVTSKTKKKGYARFIISAMVGGFAGLLTYLLCTHFNCSWAITSFATGVAGYMGDSILEVFSNFLPKLLAGKLKIEISGVNEKSSNEATNEDKDDKSK